MRRLELSTSPLGLVVCVVLGGLVQGCNLGFETTPLRGAAETLDDAPPSDTSEDLVADPGSDVADTSDADAPGDRVEDAGFSAQACDAVLGELEQTWTCVGAPPCGIAFLPFRRAGYEGAVAACVDGQALRWYPYLGGTWEPSFAHGTHLDRPLTGAWSVAGESGLGVVRRAGSDALEWELLGGVVPGAPLAVQTFGSAAGLPFAGPLAEAGLADLWVFTAGTGMLEVFDPRTARVEFSAATAGLLGRPFDGIFSTMVHSPIWIGPVVVLYDLEAGQMSLAAVGGGFSTALTLNVLTGTAVMLANVDGDAEDEVLVCRPGELAVLELQTGSQTQSLSLGSAGGCLPAVERDPEGNVHLLAFLPTAGVLLRSQ